MPPSLAIAGGVGRRILRACICVVIWLPMALLLLVLPRHRIFIRGECLLICMEGLLPCFSTAMVRPRLRVFIWQRTTSPCYGTLGGGLSTPDPDELRAGGGCSALGGDRSQGCFGDGVVGRGSKNGNCQDGRRTLCEEVKPLKNGSASTLLQESFFCKLLIGSNATIINS